MSYPQAPRRSSALPLMVAGAALVIAVWTLTERMGWLQPRPNFEPRIVTPRGDLAEFEKVSVKIFEDNKESVAHITTNDKLVRTWAGYERYPGGTGSGFVWDAQGLVVTNYHVIEGHEADRIRVSFDGENEYEAKFLNGSRPNDIAVLRLTAPPKSLRPVQLGSSLDLKVGQAVFAIGNPFGLDHTYSTGVISALDRTIRTEKSTLSGLIQVDAAINPGNSGGPLFDSAGRLIGMNTAIYSPTGASAGLGFAVPVDTINEHASKLIAGASQARPVPGTGSARLGIQGLAVQLPRSVEQRGGVAITHVEDESSAAAAGLLACDLVSETEVVPNGDIILSVDGKRIFEVSDLRSVLRGKRIGERVRLRLLRSARVQEVDVELR